MSQRTLTLPIRSFRNTTKKPINQWICNRCLATQTTTSSAASNPLLPRPIHKDPSAASDYDPTLTSSQRDYRLTSTDFHLKKALPHKIPIQYLQHSTSELLQPAEKAQRAKAVGHKNIVGVVVSAGRMEKTVKVKVAGQVWNRKIGKYFPSPSTHLVHDPNTSLVPGDVISLHRLKVSSAVHHVVASLVSPFGTRASSRPPIPTPDERLAAYKEYRFSKLHRRGLRREAAKGSGEAIRELRAMGLDPGKGVEAGKGEKANLERGTGKVRNPPKGAILGNKGQKLPEGVLPGGKHEVGKINQRAQKNKSKAMKLERQAERNIQEAEGKEQDLGRKGLGTDSMLERQSPYEKRE